MTLHQNGFEGQTDGTTVSTVNSAHSGSAFTSITINTGTFTYSSNRAVGGVMSIKISPGAGASCFARDVSFSSLSMSVSACFYYPGIPTVSAPVINLYGSNTLIAGCQILVSGKIQMINSAAAGIGTASTALIAGHWYRIEMQAFSDASAGTVTLQYYLDNGTSAVESLSASAANTRGTTIDEARYGTSNPAASGAFTDWYYDNLQAQDGTLTPLGAFGSMPQSIAWLGTL